MPCAPMFGRRKPEDEAQATRGGVLFASGTIAGESLMGVGLALLASLGINRLPLMIDEGLQDVLSLLAFAGLIAESEQNI